MFRFIKLLLYGKQDYPKIQYDNINELDYEYISNIIKTKDWPITFVLTYLIKEEDIDKVMKILLQVGVMSNRIQIINQNIKIDYYLPTHKDLSLINKMNNHLHIEGQELCRMYNLMPLSPYLHYCI